MAGVWLLIVPIVRSFRILGYLLLFMFQVLSTYLDGCSLETRSRNYFLKIITAPSTGPKAK